MRVRVINKSNLRISTDVGLLDPFATIETDLTPDQMHGLSEQLGAFFSNGTVNIHVDQDEGSVPQLQAFPVSTYGTRCSLVDQIPTTTNPTQIMYEAPDSEWSNLLYSNGNVTILVPGVYRVSLKFQAGRTGGSQGSPIWCVVWLRQNGVDVPRNASRIEVRNTGDIVTLGTSATLHCEQGDVISSWMAVQTTGIGMGLQYVAANGSVPETPSALISIVRI